MSSPTWQQELREVTQAEQLAIAAAAPTTRPPPKRQRCDHHDDDRPDHPPIVPVPLISPSPPQPTITYAPHFCPTYPIHQPRIPLLYPILEHQPVLCPPHIATHSPVVGLPPPWRPDQGPRVQHLPGLHHTGSGFLQPSQMLRLARVPVPLSRPPPQPHTIWRPWQFQQQPGTPPQRSQPRQRGQHETPPGRWPQKWPETCPGEGPRLPGWPTQAARAVQPSAPFQASDQRPNSKSSNPFHPLRGHGTIYNSQDHLPPPK